MTNLSCFKSYDIRGIIGEELDENICFLIGQAFAITLSAELVVVGRDARATSKQFSNNVIDGLVSQGVKVLSLGLCGTEEMYWATTSFKACGGIQITASHNPIDYNGMKFVKETSKPLTQKEFLNIKMLAESQILGNVSKKGSVRNVEEEAKLEYSKKILSFIDPRELDQRRIVVNCGNGAAGPTFDLIESQIHHTSNNLEFLKMFHNPDETFPNGIPNPLIRKNQAPTRKFILENNADIGIAFDGDFDRCFIYDNFGELVPGEYIVGILAETFLLGDKTTKIVHDPRVIWSIKSIIDKNNGLAFPSKTGHAFIKEKMREVDAVYGGEMSAHHYFKDFAYCDSGMIPWLLILDYLSKSENSLREIIERKKELFPSSGELNFTVKDTKVAFKRIQNLFAKNAIRISYLDGTSMEFDKWRFNLRSSNTEPVMRLNIETKGDASLLNEKKEEFIELLSGIN